MNEDVVGAAWMPIDDGSGWFRPSYAYARRDAESNFGASPVIAIKCSYCGQWEKPRTACTHCGAPIE